MRKTILFTFITALFSFSTMVSAQPFVGNWVNTNSNTSGITRVNITRSGTNYSARVWGQCTPQDCDWGRRAATRYYSGVSGTNLIGLTASYGSSGISRFVVFRLQSSNRLRAEVFTRFSDSRRNTINNYTFRRAAAAVLPAPVQVSPADGVRLTNFPRRVTLDWRPVSGAIAYVVEIGTWMPRSGGGGTWSTVQRRVTQTRFRHTHVGDQAGRWRVWAVGPGNRAGRRSGWRRFTFSTSPAVLRAPVQVSPANGRVFNRFPRTTRLNWNPVPGAVAYRVEVQYRSGGTWSTNYINRRVTASQFTFTFVGAQPGRWRVRAISSSGSEGRRSPWRTFRYTR